MKPDFNNEVGPLYGDTYEKKYKIILIWNIKFHLVHIVPFQIILHKAHRFEYIKKPFRFSFLS